MRESIPAKPVSTVSIVRYESPFESVRRAAELCQGLAGLRSRDRVFIKPNVVFWSKEVDFPKWGVITTSRVVEDMVVLLKERGVRSITIGEGIVLMDPKDRETAAHAYEALGYNTLKRRYGVETIDVHERPFRKVDFGEIALEFNADFLESDFLVDLPVMKTHAQTVVSLALKNLKGLLNIRSRKLCHSPNPEWDLNRAIAGFHGILPRGFTLIDGLYTNERGPGFDGKLRRSNLLVASADMLSADMVGARVLGQDPADVPHLAIAAQTAGRPCDLSDVLIEGENIEQVASRHGYSFPYAVDEEGELPLPLKRMGVQGLSYRKYDLTMCTYCSYLNGMILTSIAQAWQGDAWDDVEVLTGKAMRPSPGKKKTILIGKCIYQANKNDPEIREMHAVKGCPPSTKQIVAAFRAAGIPLDGSIFEHLDRVPGFFMQKYEGRPEFDPSFFRIP